MKFRNYLVLFVLVLFLAPLSMSSLQGEKKKSPQETFNQHIEEKNAKLMEKFKADDFDGMAELIGEYAVLVRPNGKRIRDKKIIKDFWKDAKKIGGWKNLTLSRIRADIIPHQFVIFGQQYDYIGIEVSEFVFSNSPRESSPGFVITVRMHREQCPWDG